MFTVIDVLSKQITQAASVETKQDKILKRLEQRFGKNLPMEIRSDGVIIIKKDLSSQELLDLAQEVNNA